ncbi:MAG: hypothetical protein PHC68_08120 [Syntrophorhabdaceae bacterium]|nr:hypothetical protein [Syntrophorhabdaceae bacterium]
MKWFKHISDSINDPFIFSLIEEFGGDGYLVFFGVLEIYSREFRTEDDWKLTEKLSYFRHNLLISSTRFKKILSKITKWDVSYNGDIISIYIPKYRELLDESTLKKLREREKSFRKCSGSVPKTEGTDIDIDIDKDKDKPLPLVADKPTTCPHQEIIKMYHDTIPELPRVMKWTPKRMKHLQICWMDKKRQSLEWWHGYFVKIRGSDFLMGKSNGFRADLEWLTIEGNLVKVIEGRYDNKGEQESQIDAWARKKKAEMEAQSGAI